MKTPDMLVGMLAVASTAIAFDGAYNYYHLNDQKLESTSNKIVEVTGSDPILEARSMINRAIPTPEMILADGNIVSLPDGFPYLKMHEGFDLERYQRNYNAVQLHNIAKSYYTERQQLRNSELFVGVMGALMTIPILVSRNWRALRYRLNLDPA